MNLQWCRDVFMLAPPGTCTLLYGWVVCFFSVQANAVDSILVYVNRLSFPYFWCVPQAILTPFTRTLISLLNSRTVSCSTGGIAPFTGTLISLLNSHTVPCSTGRIDYIHETGELTGTLLFKFMLSDTEGNDLIDQDFFITVMGKSCPIPSCLVSSCLVLYHLSFLPHLRLVMSCLRPVLSCFVWWYLSLLADRPLLCCLVSDCAVLLSSLIQRCRVL